ncbi:MAG: PAS domain-containing sensor histidine kinase [Rhodothermales bacterium]|nr:PAS domain-containing sensor histidine kinase [Rhodothermales bacterium]
MNLADRKIISASSTQNLPRLSDASSVGVAEVSRGGVVLDINELAVSLLGWKKNDRLSAPITSAIKNLPDGTPMRLPIGQEGIYVVGVSRGSGQPCLLFGFDVSSSQTLSPFQEVVDQIPVAITRSNRLGIVEFANQYARKFFGRDPVGGSLWREIILDSDLWKLDEAIQRLAENGSANTSVRYTDTAGEQRTAILYLYSTDASDHDGYIDIAGLDSEESRAFHDPFSSGVLYRTFVEQSPVGMVLLDAAGQIVMENHALRQLTGEDPDDSWLGHHFTYLTTLSNTFVGAVQTMLEEGTTFTIEDISFASHGGDYVLALRGSAIVQEDGDVAGGVILIEDRTSQKHAERIIEEARKEAVESASRKAAFISTMSHELRQPLGTISGYSDLLLQEVNELSESGAEIPGVLLEFAEAIHNRATGVLGLVDTLFDMALIDAGMITMDRAPVDLLKVADAVIKQHTPGFSSKGLDLSVKIINSPPEIEGDSRRLGQVIGILLDNALKFTREGSTTLELDVDEKNAVIRVVDTGIGIDDESIATLFNPLEQVDSRLNRDYDGAGIGLAMVDRVVRLMGGSISARNRPEGGSVFSLELPI